MPEVRLTQKEIEATIEAVDDAMGEAAEGGDVDDVKQLQSALRKLMEESETHS